MDYRKIDPELAVALEETGEHHDEPSFSVFVRTTEAADSKATAVLGSLGVRHLEHGSRVYTAELSSRAVAELSEQPWVRSLSLSRILRPLGQS